MAQFVNKLRDCIRTVNLTMLLVLNLFCIVTLNLTVATVLVVLKADHGFLSKTAASASAVRWLFCMPAVF